MILLGGSFDPVHMGHIAIADYFYNLFHASQLRLIPAGTPWQKSRLEATPEQRIDMLKLAFGSTKLPFMIDTREIAHSNPGYTTKTLHAIRKEVGNEVSLVFILGADQLLNLNTWHEWKQLFLLAHIAIAPRSGYLISPSDLSAEVHDAFFSRLASPRKIQHTPCGHTYLADQPNIAISATEIRKSIWHSDIHHPLVPPKVLDYVIKYNLYRD